MMWILERSIKMPNQSNLQYQLPISTSQISCRTIQRNIAQLRLRLISRVGSSNGAVVSLSPFPSPASSNAACEFPALRFPDNFILKPMAYLMELLSHYYNIESGSLYTTSVSHIEMCYSTSSIRNRRILVTSLDDVLLSVQPTFLRN